jgi:hypothetical protein
VGEEGQEECHQTFYRQCLIEPGLENCLEPCFLKLKMQRRYELGFLKDYLTLSERKED